jgi:hypothetical protein
MDAFPQDAASQQEQKARSMRPQPLPGSTPLTAAMSRYASQVTRLETLIRRTPEAGAAPGGSAPAGPARAISGILEAHDLIIRRLGRWPDHQIWSPDRAAALHAASGQLQDTLSAIACDHPAGHPCTCLDQITAALDEMCADLAAYGDLLASTLNAHRAEFAVCHQ